MTQEQYDKILSEKIRRYVHFYDMTTPMLYHSSGRKLNDWEEKIMRILKMADENIDLFKARHPEFTASWLKKDYLKITV